jgi:hypothetical protein
MFLSIIIATAIWKLVGSSSLLMALISFCLSSTLYKMKVHHSLYAFEHEPESVPCKLELPTLLHFSAKSIHLLACQSSMPWQTSLLIMTLHSMQSIE